LRPYSTLGRSRKKREEYGLLFFETLPLDRIDLKPSNFIYSTIARVHSLGLFAFCTEQLEHVRRHTKRNLVIFFFFFGTATENHARERRGPDVSFSKRFRRECVIRIGLPLTAPSSVIFSGGGQGSTDGSPKRVVRRGINFLEHEGHSRTLCCPFLALSYGHR